MFRCRKIKKIEKILYNYIVAGIDDGSKILISPSKQRLCGKLICISVMAWYFGSACLILYKL